MLPIAVRPPAFVQLPEDVADSVDRPLLWVKLRRVGMEVTVFELYRHIYSNLSYIVRVAGEFPDAFTSDIGVLIGDPASPIMWNIFFADLILPDTIVPDFVRKPYITETITVQLCASYITRPDLTREALCLQATYRARHSTVQAAPDKSNGWCRAR